MPFGIKDPVMVCMLVLMVSSDLPSNEFKQGHFTKVPVIVNRDVSSQNLLVIRSVLTVAGIRRLQLLTAGQHHGADD